MRLLVTVETGAHEGSGSRHDVVVSYTPETLVADLIAALAGPSMPANVVALPGASAVPQLTAPMDLYLAGERLDPEQTVDASPVRHGAVLGLGAPSSHRVREPDGLVEVRIAS